MVIVAELGDCAVEIWDLTEQYLAEFSNKENGSWIRSTFVLCARPGIEVKQLNNYVYKRYHDAKYLKLTKL